MRMPSSVRGPPQPAWPKSLRPCCGEAAVGATPFGRSPSLPGRSRTSQWTKPRASGSSTTSTSAAVPACTPVHFNGGETFAPSQENSRAMASPSANAVDVRTNGPRAPADELAVELESDGLAVIWRTSVEGVGGLEAAADAADDPPREPALGRSASPRCRHRQSGAALSQAPGNPGDRARDPERREGPAGGGAESDLPASQNSAT